MHWLLVYWMPVLLEKCTSLSPPSYCCLKPTSLHHSISHYTFTHSYVPRHKIAVSRYTRVTFCPFQQWIAFLCIKLLLTVSVSCVFSVVLLRPINIIHVHFVMSIEFESINELKGIKAQADNCRRGDCCNCSLWAITIITVMLKARRQTRTYYCCCFLQRRLDLYTFSSLFWWYEWLTLNSCFQQPEHVLRFVLPIACVYCFDLVSFMRPVFPFGKSISFGFFLSLFFIVSRTSY